MPKADDDALAPYWQTTDSGRTVRLYHGDVIDVLRRLPERSVQCVITSPPYWGLRDYSMCGCRVHIQNGTGGSIPGNSGADSNRPRADPNCRACGGTGRVVGMAAQIGSERTPAEYVEKMVAVFREVRRVLRDDGTLWMNLGDSYGNTGACGGASPVGERDYRATDRTRQEAMARTRADYGGLKNGNLVGIPWRVALALQTDGWILRQDIIWHKPSPMPESVRNRCTKAHEYLFLLAKRDGYYYDAEAIKETALQPLGHAVTAGKQRKQEALGTKVDTGSLGSNYGPDSRNKRSVWTIASAPYEGAHFATFPPKLVEPCILAGTSAKGACGKCGVPYRRIVEKRKLVRERPNDYVKRHGQAGTGSSCANTVAGVEARTVGWEPTCVCGVTEVRPCIVLDPFVGSGTTCAVAVEHGRASVGIDLSEAYLRDNAVPRVEGTLLERGLGNLARK